MSRRPVTRRGLLGGAGAGVLAVGLSACGIRLESGAPAIPGLQTQGPPVDTAALQATVASRTMALETLAQPSAGLQTSIKPAYRQQLSRLQAVMASAGMPEATSSPTTGTTAKSLVGFETFIRAQLNASTFARIAGAEAAYVPMLAASSALDAGAALSPQGVAAQGPAPAWPTAALPADVAVGLLPAVREAVYGLEVIAAKSALSGRARVTATLHTMYPIRAQLEAIAGDAAPPLHSTYALTPDPSTDQARTTLARHLLTAVVAACADQAAATKGSADHVGALLHVWGTALTTSWTWGVPPVAFPGLAE
ncbi:hypothetical protein ATK17_1922 [Branchiibius hedensis]|uniref:DUF4439 domain-containing protein n=1 Tax=Branchiibius hedensis TaxID=672460 RepID=A0A2Y8ZXJ5_9MICO|nr:hypothetical protein [Branchiibius hedensis]PWJ25784.1 hypothetical protein ATK17_1922 [Branchiibius hedensis]SSA34597.1 hypothetical protein SAMN04489750_1922 [Branchiibius hedensis]